MIRKTFLFIFVISTAWTQISTAQQSKIRPEVWQKIQKEGAVQVIVRLKVPWTMERMLSPEEKKSQRDAIAAAQQALTTELVGTQYKVLHQYQSIPTIVLEAGSDALSKLDRSSRVREVRAATIETLEGRTIPN